jgi:deazaflavin-dependent oxidoreductase (nitroreductase family)
VSDRNAKVIDEFRSNGGRVGGPFEGAPLLLLHTVGAKSGATRVNPMMYQDLGGGRVAVFASKAGAPVNPGWYHNLLAEPDVVAEIGTEERSYRARVAAGEEREQIWSTQKARYGGFADYEARADREIPVVILKPRSKVRDSEGSGACR